jgi:hypothetical protein
MLLAAGALVACGAEPADIAARDCDLNRGACAFPLAGGGSGRIEFDPHPLPLMRPIAVTVRVPPEVVSARLDFQGTAMDMGFNQVTLRPTGPGVLGGSAMLPVCATGSMRWRADLYLGDATTPAARFEFDTAPSPG